ncbi:histone H1 SCDLUD_002104 [Saccharomycodes ludwigii]|uniref:histone H1 n=1 Tax=Saccharomycodes ludwigii TaxID=36035 RepID=UPI001E8A1B3B|nr:hypothetical protein SCDLUD_002104 [Saccharomycodes ludwigii]KAH3902286.1 hypothetical protein SCDLUD_002104 [Saccharomycodes ludwigii]
MSQNISESTLTEPAKVVAPKGPSSKKSSGPSYQTMIKEAILAESAKGAASRQAIKKYIAAKYPTSADHYINQAIKKGVDNGSFTQPKGASGPLKLSKKAIEPKKKSVSKKTESKKKPTANKITEIKKQPVTAKKTETKKPVKKAISATNTSTSTSTTSTSKKPVTEASKKKVTPTTNTEKKTDDKLTYKEMVSEAISTLKERQGSSRQAIKKYVKGKFPETASAASFDHHFNNAIKKGVEQGLFVQPKGASGPVKLNKTKSNISSKKVIKKKVN